MRILHTMLRVGDLQRSLDFYTRILGMKLLRQSENTEYKYTLREGDPRRIGALAYLTPLLSTLFLVLINGESLSLRHVVAGVLIIGGALLGIRRSASTR